ncbi:MAG: glucosidase [Acidimicrobiales bacterium]|nr:glucosidase [Acidimicrobiales bacterium]
MRVTTPEHDRLADADAGVAPWRQWGPYLAERAWGTVREDYSADGDAWSFFPYEHARSRTYRWNEDGLCGWSDDHQFLCLALALWNGRDAHLKERIFGLDQHQANHGEDAKEAWWYVDGTPTHSWMSWRYHYPRRAFPYDDLRAENGRRTRADPEYEVLDTGVFDDGFWQIDVDVAKASADDLSWRITARNLSPEVETLHVLPTLWFRNTWSWGRDDRRPRLWWEDGAVQAEHEFLGRYSLRSDGQHDPLFCENETNTARVFQSEPTTPFPKDGIGDHVLTGAATVNPALEGTKAALHHVVQVAPGATVTLELRLSREPRREDAVSAAVLAPALAPAPAPAPAAARADLFAVRRGEADAFYAAVVPDGVDEEARSIARQAFAGLCWSKQWFHFDVAHWLDGDPASPAPPPGRGHIRNGGWRHLRNADVVLMPDPWEYPWYATWDLAFHCVVYAHLDPTFAKQQLVLFGREWYMHPEGQLPAYEWSFDDVNPPVHAWAARRVFEIDGSRDADFLERVFHKLLLNFTWWVNRKDVEGDNVFEGGFLGLDNIGPFDRSKPIPGGGVLEQSDGTAWMARYCLDMLDIALTLALRDRVYEDITIKFFEHFALIAAAMERQGMWHEADGFYHDQLRLPDGTVRQVESYSLVGLLPLTATAVMHESARSSLGELNATIGRLLRFRRAEMEAIAHCWRNVQGRTLMTLVPPERVERILERMLDEEAFLSPYGIRSLSRWHRDHPLEFEIGGSVMRLDYEPAESTTALFGGNSNWRGPVWFPVNYLVIESLRRLHDDLGETFTVECPTGSGRRLDLGAVADELSDRLVTLFRRRADGTRPCFGGTERQQHDPAWNEHVQFHEYFHGDDGAGLGASHQTGWTALVALLILERRPPG